MLAEPQPARRPRPLRAGRARRLLWIAAGLALTGLAVVGALLPLLPSTIFALGAGACFAKSSPALESWLLNHRLLGPSIAAWRAERAIPTSVKAVAVASMSLSAIVLAMTQPLPVTVLASLALAAYAAFVVSRPRPSSVSLRSR